MSEATKELARRVAFSERFRRVSNRYPRRVAEAYDRDLEQAMSETDEQVAASVAAWECDHGIEPREWQAIGAAERDEEALDFGSWLDESESLRDWVRDRESLAFHWAESAAANEGFEPWLDRQRERSDPTGDLARDYARDPYWPEGSYLSALHRYLDQMGGSEVAHEALDRAWAEWETLIGLDDLEGGA